MTQHYVVVPEGLAKDLCSVSFLYRHVLDQLAPCLQSEDEVFLAPANAFGGPIHEQWAAFRYLSQKTAASLVAPHTDSSSYVDTRGNAVLLKHFLLAQHKWPLPQPILVVYHLHAARAERIFRQEGYQFASVMRIPPFAGTKEPIVRRLWYYRYSLLHRLYESLAYPLYLFHLL